MAAFEEFGVLPELGAAVDDLGWTLPTDVQAEAIPLILGGGDVLMAAETGSGKTGAFCLPVLQVTWESLRELAGGPARPGSRPSQSTALAWRFSALDRGPGLAGPRPVQHSSQPVAAHQQTRPVMDQVPGHTQP